MPIFRALNKIRHNLRSETLTLRTDGIVERNQAYVSSGWLLVPDVPRSIPGNDEVIHAGINLNLHFLSISAKKII